MMRLIILLCCLSSLSFETWGANKNPKRVAAVTGLTITKRTPLASLPLSQTERGMIVNVHFVPGSFKKKIVMVAQRTSHQSEFKKGDTILQATRNNGNYEITEVKHPSHMYWIAIREGSDTSKNKILLQAKGMGHPEFLVERKESSRQGLIETSLAFIDPHNSHHIGEKLKSVQPKWDKRKRGYTLELHGVTDIASRRNHKFNDSQEKPILLVGRLKDKSLNIYFRHPFSPLQAFIVALSTL